MQQKILEANGQNASIKNDYDESMQFSLRDINNAILFFLFLSLFVLFVWFFFFFGSLINLRSEGILNYGII